MSTPNHIPTEVNRPSHYVRFVPVRVVPQTEGTPSDARPLVEVECIDIINTSPMLRDSYLLGSAFKYLFRADNKGTKEDISKALKCLQLWHEQQTALDREDSGSCHF